MPIQCLHPSDQKILDLFCPYLTQSLNIWANTYFVPTLGSEDIVVSEIF